MGFHHFANCVFISVLFCYLANSSPILIDELEPVVIGVEVEDRIANPASSSSSSSSASLVVSAASSSLSASSGVAGSILDELVPSIHGVEVEDRIANPAASSVVSSSSSSSVVSDSSSAYTGSVSIGDLFGPDIHGVDIKDEDRSHPEEEEVVADVGKDGEGCVGEGCVCPSGTKGIQPFCIPIEEETDEDSHGHDDYDDIEEIPMDFYEKIAGLKSVEAFINLTKIDVGLIGSATNSLTTLPAEGCLPKKKCISVRPKNRHPSEDVFPSSVDVERCGGCCGHPDLTCLPWSTEPMTVKLLKYGYNADGTLANLGFVTTSVIREVKCKCVKVQS